MLREFGEDGVLIFSEAFKLGLGLTAEQFGIALPGSLPGSLRGGFLVIGKWVN
jgi:hypothetical protein